jgi:aryl-alcohol dehydrogenase-like predicted oxidoreductase
MRTQRLGSSGPDLSVIGYGAWEAGGDDWGPNPPDDVVIDAILSAIDAGIDWIDTAEVYGQGVSEKFVGRAVAGRRDEVLIASKVAPVTEGTGFRPDQVRAACEASLERLAIDVIDLYQLHWPDDSAIPLEDTWGAMAGLVEDGKVRYIGLSNFQREAIERCEAIRHVDSLQQEFSMLVTVDRELIRWCGEVGTGVVAYSPLAVGMLTGRFDAAAARAVDDWRRDDPTGPFAETNIGRSVAVADGVRGIAAEIGCTAAQLALAWNWHQPGVTSAIAGSRDAAHVRDNAAAGALSLHRDTLAALDALVAD